MATESHYMDTYTWSLYGTNKTTGYFETTVEEPNSYDEHNDPGLFRYISIHDYKVWSVSPYGLQASGLNMAANVGDVYLEDRGKSWDIGEYNASWFEPSGGIVRDWYSRTKEDRYIPVNVYYWGPGSIDVTETVYVTVPKRDSRVISFDANGGSGTVPQDITKFYRYDEIAPSASLTMTGCSFAGWSFSKLSPSLSVPSDVIAAGSPITSDDAGDVVLYAVWKLEYIQPTIGAVNSVRIMKDGEPTREINITFDARTKRNLPEEELPTISVDGIVVSHTDSGIFNEKITVTQDIDDISIFHVKINYMLGSVDSSDSVMIYVTDSNRMTSIATTNVSAPGVALHVIGVPGSDSFGFGVNTFARNGYIEMKSSKGILYNDSPATLFGPGEFYGGDGETLELNGDINKFIAIDVFCSDDEGHQFTQRFIKSGSTWDESERYLLYCVFANQVKLTQYIKSEVLSFYVENGISYVKIIREACVGSVTDGTVIKSSDYSTWYIKINKIVGHATLMGLTTVDSGTGSGGHEYFAGYGLRLVGYTFNADIAKADLDKVDSKINSIPITFIEGM